MAIRSSWKAVKLGKSSTMRYFSFRHTTGYEKNSPCSTPYSPLLHTAIDFQSAPSLSSQSRLCAKHALAAEAAELDPRASIIAAPRFPTVDRNSAYHAWISSPGFASANAVSASFPRIVALVRSANIVGE